MRLYYWILTLSLALPSLLLAQLKVYGPGGPLGPMRECAEQFFKARGVTVDVVAGPEKQWYPAAEKDADLIFGGAEYMLTSFALNHPGFIDSTTRTSLYIRAAGILVRKGNPKNISSLEDLTRDGIRIVDVNGAGQVAMWEDLAGRKGLIPGIQKNIAVSVNTSAEAIEIWKNNPAIDAWINFASWHYRLLEETDVVLLPDNETVYRGTPVALTTFTDQRALAKEFVEFLKSEAGHAIFQKWGWK